MQRECYCEDLTYVWVTLSSKTRRPRGIGGSAKLSNTEQKVYSMICIPIVPLTLGTKKADQHLLDTVKWDHHSKDEC
jgi:hypothetical protein